MNKFKMRKSLLVLIVTLLMVSLCACNNSAPTEDNTGETPVEKMQITVSAAASLQDAMEELKETYESENENIELVVNYGSSGALMKQIQEGAEVDLFISAAQKQMNELEEMDLLINESRIDLLGNDLVLLVNDNYKDKIKSVNDLLNLEDEMIAIGAPDSVPAGKYASEALTNLGLYEDLEDKFVLAKNVRQVVTYVDSENVVAGFCYGSDTLIATNSSIAEVIGEDSHKPIVYPAAIIKDTKNMNETEKLLDFLKSDESLNIFEKYGFKKID